MAALCLFSNASAQTQTAASPVATGQEPAEAPVFRLVTIGKQTLLATEENEAAEEEENSVCGQSLAAMINFFLEVPPVATEK